MFAQRSFFANAQALFDQEVLTRGGDSDPSREFVRRLCKQAKQISQIISYMWLWADEDVNQYPEQVTTAISLKQYFAKPNQPEGNLIKLLTADPYSWLKTSEPDRKNRPANKEEKLLFHVFGQDRVSKEGEFPIFNEVEVTIYTVSVDVNAFQGTIQDPDLNAPNLMKFNIPFPPSPKFGEATVTQQELKDWIDNKEPNQFIAPNPYIPTSCS